MRLRSLLSNTGPALLGIVMLLAVSGGTSLVVTEQAKIAEMNSSLVVQRANAARVLSAVQQAESGQRGYLLTGEPDYLEPYTEAVDSLQDKFKELKLAYEGQSPMYSDLIDQLTRYTNAKMAELKRTVDLERAGKHEEAMKIVRTNEGRDLMQVIHDIVIQIKDLNAAEHDENSMRAVHYSRILSVSIVLIVLSCLFGGGMILRNLITTNSRLEATIARRDALELQVSTLSPATRAIIHDLNNTLMGASGALEIMQARIAASSYEKLPRYAGIIEQALAKAADLIQKLRSIPKQEASQSPTEPHQQPSAPPAAYTGPATILVVDDDPVICEVVREGLCYSGFHVILADSGRAALDHLKPGSDIDLLLTDMSMPGMDGRELTDAARLILPDLPVLYMSGLAENILRELGDLGDNKHTIAKPFTIEVLRGKIRSILA